METLHVLFWVAGTFLPLFATGHVFLSRTRVYPAWAKIVWIGASILGLLWGSLGWILAHWRTYHLTQQTYYNLIQIRGLLWGIILGFIIIFVIGKPYHDVEGQSSGKEERGQI